MKKIIFAALLIVFCVYLWRSEAAPKPVPTPAPIQQATTTAAVIITPPDPRIALLTTFFTAYKCPAINFELINDYLSAADYYKIDYRLLPAISIIESGCAQHTCPSNFWGWNSCKDYPFADPVGGINYISANLAGGHYYRGKTIDQKLRAYNPNPSYAPEVEKLMKEIN